MQSSFLTHKKIYILIFCLFFISACSSNGQKYFNHYENDEYEYAVSYDFDVENILIGDCQNEGEEELEIYEQHDVIDIFSYDDGFISISSLNDALMITNKRRQITHELDFELINNWIEDRTPKIFNGAELFTNPNNSSISQEEANYDIDILFQLIEHMYAGFHYFGGVDVFSDIKNNILYETSKRYNWSKYELTEIIVRNLRTVITDYHFQIGRYSGSTFGNPYNFFIWDSPFDKTENGFYHRETSRYVLYVENHDLYELFRLAVNEYGEFHYIPVIYQQASKGNLYDLSIVFENGETEKIRLISYDFNRTHLRGINNSLNFINDIPIVSIRRMGDFMNPYALNFAEAQEVLSLADYLIDEPVIIIDIRSNEGGASAFSHAWLYRLLGEVVPTNFNWLGFFDSEIYLPFGVSRPASWYRGFLSRAGLDFSYPSELFGRYLHMTEIADGIKFTPEESRKRVISNDRLIIVLIDRFTLSSGELFTDQFTNIENTLVVGQNTFGMLLTSSDLPLYLPNSGIIVSMGQYKLLHPEGTWTEGVGFAPDVWVTGDALVAALALANEYLKDI